MLSFVTVAQRRLVDDTVWRRRPAGVRNQLPPSGFAPVLPLAPDWGACMAETSQ